MSDCGERAPLPDGHGVRCEKDRGHKGYCRNGEWSWFMWEEVAADGSEPPVTSRRAVMTSDRALEAAFGPEAPDNLGVVESEPWARTDTRQ